MIQEIGLTLTSLVTTVEEGMMATEVLQVQVTLITMVFQACFMESHCRTCGIAVH
jgi:hypothetical protein